MNPHHLGNELSSSFLPRALNVNLSRDYLLILHARPLPIFLPTKEQGASRDGKRDQKSSGGADSNSDLKNGDSSENPASSSSSSNGANGSHPGEKSNAATSRATPATGGGAGGNAQNGGAIGGVAKQAEQDPDDAMAKFLWKSSSSKKPPMVMFQVNRYESATCSYC